MLTIEHIYLWMDQALVPGAEAWLKGRGGLRCRVLANGWLRRDR